MSVFDLDEKGQRSIAEYASQNPMAPEQIAPSALTGTGYGIGMGTMRGGARVGQFLGMAGAVVPMAIDKVSGTDLNADNSLTDSYFGSVVKAGNASVDYWTPAPNEVGAVGRTLGGLSEIVLPLMAAGGNPVPMIGSQQMGTSIDLVRDGVDPNLAVNVGGIQGLSTAIGFRLPFLGSTLATRMGSGVAGNLVTNAGGQALQAEALKAGGYTEQAKQFDPLNAEARFVDVLTGIAFGGIAHASAPRLKPSDVDAVLTANNAKHFQSDTAPGTPADGASSAAHQSALETAVSQLMRGERVSIADSINEAQFIKPPMREKASVTAVREAIGDIQSTEPRLAQIDPQGRRALRYNAPELDDYARMVEQANNLPPGLIVALKNAGEKSGSDAVSPKGALGVMQFMPDTWTKFGEGDPRDPVASIQAAGRYLAATLKQYGGNVDAVIADYNGGPRQANRVVKGEAPKAKETADYLGRVQRYMANYKTPADMMADMPQGRDLTAAQRVIERRLANKITDDYPAAVEQYQALPDSLGGKVLNVDTARELSGDYSANMESRALLSSAVHEPASYFIKKLYADRLAEIPKDSTVMFTSGGTGAGKSTAIGNVPSVADAMGRAALVYDTNMNGLQSALKKIEQALEAGMRVEVVHVQRDPVDSLLAGALPRAQRMGRAVPLDAHEATHIGSAETIGQIAEHYRDDPRVSVRVLDNTRGRGGAVEAPIDFVKSFDYNNLRERLISALDQEYQNGRISEAIYRGTLGRDPTQPGVLRPAADPRVSDGLPQRQRTGNPNPDAGRGEAGPSGSELGSRQASPDGLSADSPTQAPIDPLVTQASEIAATRPDLVITDPDGVQMTAAEAMAIIDADIAQAQSDAKGFTAAITCFLQRGGD